MFRYAQHITALVTIMTYITFPIYSNTHLTTHMQYVGQLNTFSYAVLSPYTLQTLSLLASLKFGWNIILFSVG